MKTMIRMLALPLLFAAVFAMLLYGSQTSAAAKDGDSAEETTGTGYEGDTGKTEDPVFLTTMTLSDGDTRDVYSDLNGDGFTDSADASFILRFDAGFLELSDKQKNAADLNGDGEADSADASLLLGYDSGSAMPEPYYVSYGGAKYGCVSFSVFGFGGDDFDNAYIKTALLYERDCAPVNVYAFGSDKTLSVYAGKGDACRVCSVAMTENGIAHEIRDPLELAVISDYDSETGMLTFDAAGPGDLASGSSLSYLICRVNGEKRTYIYFRIKKAR